MEVTALMKSPGNYAEWKKPVSKGYMLCGSIYMKFSKRQNYRDGEQISGCQDLGAGGGCDYKGRTRGTFLG